jgi:hypothetical protein
MDIKVKKQLLWAVLFSTSFMAFLLRRIEWSDFSLIVERLNVIELFAAYGVFILANLIRALRFFKLDHMDNKLSHWWHINAFYNFITATLPGGAGEAATAFALKRFSKFNLLGALRILLISRLMDLFALSALFFLTAVQISNVTPYRETAILISGVLLFISFIALIPASERFILRLLQRLPGQSILVHMVSKKLSELLHMSEEQRNNHSFRITLFQSVLMMMTVMASVHLLLRSFGLDFTLLQSVYCFGVYAVFQTVPVQGIAGLGTQAAWWSLALNTAGYNASEAIAMGFILHGTFYLFVALLGLSSFLAWLKGRRKNKLF